MRIEDEKVEFYLRNREQLEQWFALRAEAAAAIDEWLASLKPDVETLVAELAGDVEFFASLDEEQPFPGLFLKRTCWPGTGRDAPVLIGLQWSRGKTLLRAGSAPWVVVRSEKSSSIGSGLRDDERFKQIRKARRDKGTQWYAAFGSVLPQGPFPEGAEGYRQVLLNSIRQAWKAYAGVVDEVIEELKPTAGMIPPSKGVPI